MALDRLLAEPQWKIEGLLTTLDRTNDRVAMHDVRADGLRAQAAALGLPLIEIMIDWHDRVHHHQSDGEIHRAKDCNHIVGRNAEHFWLRKKWHQ